MNSVEAAQAVNTADAAVDDLDRQIARLAQERGAAEADLAAAHRNYDRLPLTAASARIRGMEARVDGINRQISVLTLRRGSAEVARNAARRAYDKLVATARVSGAMAAAHMR